MADFDWGSLAGAGLNALANYWSGNQLGKANDTAVRAADPFAQYRDQYAQNLNNLPSYQSRQTSLNSGPWTTSLNALQANPSSFTSNPGYQFGLNQGIQAIDRSASSKGLLDSGRTGKALTRFGQDYAGQQFNNERNFLAGRADNEKNFNANQFENERQFLGKASGALNDPYAAALLGLLGREGQLGQYNEGIGQLLKSLTGGSGGQSSGGNGLINSGINAFKNWLSAPGTVTAGSELGQGMGGAFDSWAATQPGLTESQLAQYGSSGADFSGLGSGASGYGSSAVDWGAGLTEAELNGLYGTGAESFGSGSAAATTGADAAATGATAEGTGAAGAGAGVGAGTVATGAIGAMIAYGKIRDAIERRNKIEGANRTRDRLLTAGVSEDDIAMDKMFNVTTPWTSGAPDYGQYVQDLTQTGRYDAQTAQKMYQTDFGPDRTLDQAYWQQLQQKYPELANSNVSEYDLLGDYWNISGGTNNPELAAAQKQWEEFLASFGPMQLYDNSGGGG